MQSGTDPEINQLMGGGGGGDSWPRFTTHYNFTCHLYMLYHVICLACVLHRCTNKKFA